MPQRHRIPIYRLHKQSGQAVVTLPDGFGSRRDVLLGRHGSEESRAEYLRVIGEWEANGRRVKQDLRRGGLTVNGLLLSYVKYAETHYTKNGKPTAELDCIKSACRPVKALYGHTLVGEFGPLALKAVREQMVKDNWSRGFINRCVGRIKRVFRWAVENEMLPSATFEALRTVPGLQRGRTEARETPGRHPVSQEHIDAVRKIVRQRTRDLIDLQLLTATRPGELLSLTTRMIDQRDAVWFARLTSHKTEHRGKARSLFFGPKAQLILRKYLKPDAPDARLWRQRSFRNALRNACTRLRIPRFTPHWLRHTAATAMREQYGAEAAQVILGHSQLSTTEIYAQKNEKLARQVAANVG